jgi:hypothetical protein
MRFNIDYVVTVFTIAFVCGGFWLVPNGHEIIGGLMIGAASLFVVILLGRANADR